MPANPKEPSWCFFSRIGYSDTIRGEISSEKDSAPESKISQSLVFLTYAIHPRASAKKGALKFQAVPGLTARNDIGLSFELGINFRLSDPTKVI
jgi:hypothetical protein